MMSLINTRLAKFVCITVSMFMISLSSNAENNNIDNDDNSYCHTIDTIITDNFVQALHNSSYTADLKDYDKNLQANIIIESVLTNYAKTKNSLGCRFKNSKEENLNFLTSDDGKFRVFTWDVFTGGTMHNYAGFIQYLDDDGNIHLKDLRTDEEPLHSFASNIFTTTVNDQKLYMLVSTGRFSTMDNSQILKMYQINNQQLISPKLIKTNSGLTNSVGFGYDFFSVTDRPRPIQLFDFDKNSQIFRFPIVIDDSEYPAGKVTNNSIEYKFDGQYFQRYKN